MFDTPSWDRDEDGYPCPEPEDTEDALRCQSCGCETAELVTAVWDSRRQVCAACEFPEEPECECRQTDVDMFSAIGCELHDQSSTWNVRMAAIREDAAAIVAPILPQLERGIRMSACPFCHSTQVGHSGPFSECGNCRQIWNPGLAKGKVA